VRFSSPDDLLSPKKYTDAHLVAMASGLDWKPETARAYFLAWYA